MIKIRFGHRNAKFFVLLSSSLLFGVVFFVLLNLSTPLSREEAEVRVRTFLSREITQHYMSILMNKQVKQRDVEIGWQLEKELGRINDLEFVSIEVRRLIPDILLRPHIPTHVVQVIVRDQNRQYPPRYFWMPWGDVDSETSKYAWMFSI
jgi:hypothetical protein